MKAGCCILFLQILLICQSAHASLPKARQLHEDLTFPDLSIRAITQDLTGFIWVGTNQGVFRTDGRNLSTQILPENQFNPIVGLRVNSVWADTNNRIWIGTNDQGLYIYDQKQLISVNQSVINFPQKINKIIPAKSTGKVWLATGSGLIGWPDDWTPSHTQSIDNPKLTNLNVTSFTESNGHLFVGTTEGLHVLDTQSSLSNTYFEDLIIHEMWVSESQQLWLATNKGLYYSEDTFASFSLLAGTANTRVTDLQLASDILWAATIRGGLLQIDLQTKDLIQHNFNGSERNGLSSDLVMSLYTDKDQRLWVGHFSSGLDIFPLKDMSLGLKRPYLLSPNCSNKRAANAFLKKAEHLLVGTEGGLMRLSDASKNCEFIPVPNLLHESTMVNDIALTKQNNEYLLATSEGIYRYDTSMDVIEPLFEAQLSHPFNFIDYDQEKSVYYLGGAQGLWRMDDNYTNLIKLPYFKTARFYGSAGNQTRLFVTNTEVLRLSDSDYLESVYKPSFNLLSIASDSNETVWIGSSKHGLLKMSEDGMITPVWADKPQLEQASVMSIILKSEIVWAATDHGIVKYDTRTDDINHFSSPWGLQAQKYLLKASYIDMNDNMYFGGQSGFNVLKSNAQLASASPPEVVLTELKRFNRTVWPGQKECDLCIDQPISTIDKLNLSHQDDIISLHWAAMDFDMASNTYYAYRLLGLEEQWNFVDDTTQNITYTSLRPGNYQFEVKASHDSVNWSENTTKLSIQVKPAPWLSIWALISYVMVMLIAVLWFIRYRTSSARQRALVLEQSVKERTIELEDKNKVIAELLQQKNALFANITHEFKTPLTLIQGPLGRLRKALSITPKNQESTSGIDEVEMIDRNANRLLHMVGHLLKLSEAEDVQRQEKVTVNLSVITAMIVDSFRPLAMDKSISLILIDSECPVDVGITVAPESYEMILGNLISNAIKYCPPSSRVEITIKASDDQVLLVCEDDGPGIPSSEHAHIFERFSRLQSTSHIDGNGIGLAVVKQLVEMNHGTIELHSEVGKGAQFSITLPRSYQTISQSQPHDVITAMAKKTQNDVNLDSIHEATISDSKDEINESDSLPEILIIEDNHDMRQYIQRELADSFHCHLAHDGIEGIASGLRLVPDLVVCDVMMPGKDGYQVASELRQDQRTSHIPIVLLTALNTAQSRILGWQEHVDCYLSKPFNSEELLIRLHSILAIRKLLQAKNAKRFAKHDSLDLPSIDHDFIKKLNQVIANHYQDADFQRGHMASEMAISERQLLRKTRALIDITPMDALRDYRLQQAIELLQSGKPVNLVSDTCGFNSTSYFVRCFKAKYDITPKQYQKQITNS